MSPSKLRNKFLACVFGMLAGLSLVGVAQVPGPINLRGLGGDTIQEIQASVTGTGGAITVVDIPLLGTCTNCLTSTDGGAVIHVFNSSGSFTPPAGLTAVDVLVVGGGGGGGRGNATNTSAGGGGGAGAVVYQAGRAVTPSTPVTVTVGGGGAGASVANDVGVNGTGSAFGALTAAGGGGGGGGDDAGQNGASGGGGGASNNSNRAGGTGSAGNNGGASNGANNGNSGNRAGGGGGGAGAVGANATNAVGGAGGAGTPNAITGASVTYGGGGGGGAATGGAGGAGGGGTGASGAAAAGTANTGGGGGGSRSGSGGTGGSGIVIVRYTPPASGLQRVVHTFTSTGTTQFTSPAGLTSIDVLVVGGGGGGGGVTSGNADVSAGGGGGGAYRYVAGQAISGSTVYNVTVGAGGTAGVGGTSDGGTGTDSSFGALVVAGGGGGGASDGVGGNAGNNADADGGSGGGGRAGGAGGAAVGGAGVGSNGGGSSATGGGGGGGGPQSTGSAGTANTAGSGGAGGNGGYGTVNTITGTAVSYGGGGGGGAYSSGGNIAGGIAGIQRGGGGAGGASTGTTNRQAGAAATANTGGGGGGGSGSSGTSATAANGGAGGSGIVVISYIQPTVTYITHTFTTVGVSSFTPPPGVTNVEVLVVGGGGGGGASIPFGDAGSGGGGAGGLVYNAAFAVTPGVATSVTVGGGGAGGDDPGAHEFGANGGNSVFGTLTALGGGGGAGGNAQGSAGGSGGGSRGFNGGAGNQPTSPSGGFGNRGGNMPGSAGGAPGTGGGGAGAAGADLAGTTGETGHNGGIGREYDISGSATYYAGGGGGGTAQNRTAVSAGGLGGGGAGGRSDTPATPGTANTGGGGGGGNDTIAGAAGGSGIVIVRYRPPTMTLTQQPSTPVTSGQVFATQPQVTLQTATGAAISGANVIAGIQSGTGTLGGTTTVATNGSGVAVYTNLSLSGSAGNLLLDFNAANATGETVSNAVELQTYSIRITHGSSYPLCTPSTPITLEVLANGVLVPNFSGSIELSNTGNHGDYAINTGAGSLLGTGDDDGTVIYNFAGLADGGDVVLDFTTDNAGSITFNAEDTVDALLVDDDTNLPLDVVACEFRITHGGTGANCAPNTVTIGLYSPDGTLQTGYLGLVTLSASGALGDWSGGANGGAGMNNGTANDGIATYQFQAADNGQAVLNFNRTTVGTVNFNVQAGSVGVAAGFDPDLNVQSCYFRISHDASGDVCTPEAITITVVNAAGATQTSYVSTVNITTATGIGDWTGGVGLNNAVANDGAASYTFQAADNGVATVFLTHHSTSASVNINLNSGAFQEDPLFDPALAVAACTLRLSLASPNATACTSATLTLGVYNSGGTLATNYAGTVELTTSTSHGSWLSTNGAGTLVDSNPGNGTGSYTFVAGDGGDVNLVFTSDDVEVLNFNATGNTGAITVDPAFDPDLNITACLPIVAADVCYVSQNQPNAITLASGTDTQNSRMVLMYINSESETPATSATINGVAMTLLRTQMATSAQGNTLQVYGILDADLPANAGTYAAAFTGSANTPAMCIVALQGVAQQFPLEDTPASDGQLNGNNLDNANPITTGITTNENNSIVIGVAANGSGGTTYTASLDEQLWQAGVADAASSDWAGFYDYQLAAASVTVTHTASATPNRQVQIALAISPFVTGAPAVTGYVPVTLYETFAGNLDYIAIGNTLRASSIAQCLMVTTATGTTAVANLPADSTIEAAYLYWAGSGYEANADANVTFGIEGSPNNITADEVFIIEPNQVYNDAYAAVPEGFFAAYKDVTSLVSANSAVTYRFSNLTVQTGTPWSTYSTCLGGWSLVIVYENELEDLNVINLFHGFQPFWHSAFTLVPRNFRMATPDGDDVPHAQITHVTFEGDNADGDPAGCGPDGTGVACNQTNLNDLAEVFELQDDPNAQTFEELNNSFNTTAPGISRQYNSTVSYPNYDANLDWLGTYSGSTTSYGADVDTYFVEGDTSGELIYPFGALEAEQITTRYSTGQDIVLLVGEFISVTNAPIADLEVFVSDAGAWKVGALGTASYEYVVTNNGNGAVTGGFASGDVILTGNMPTGITIASISAPGWDCALATTTAFTCILEITEANVGSVTDMELGMGESLPTVTVTVDIDDESTFPLLDNDITTVARLGHVGEYYAVACQGQGAPAGVQPDPNPATGCSKPPQFDNKNDLNKYLVDVDDLDEKSVTNNNVDSNTRNVRGIETNLGINKALAGILEANEPAVYSLSVQNLGPDATTKTLTVTDTLPAGLVPQSAAGTDWNCSIVGQLVTCTRANSLGIGASAPAITITTLAIAAPAVEGAFVSNTATVAAGQYNFDNTPGNNSDTDISEVTGPIAAASDIFLISVTENGTTIGGLTFDAGDLVLYDPDPDDNPTTEVAVATMFLDESSIPGITSLGNIDAVHLLPNGHVLLSTATDGSSIAGLTFNAEDIVRYDPVLQTATLVFDGSAIFASDTADIDAIYVVYNDSYTPADWDIVLSTTADATIGALSFQDNDLVAYDMSGAVASLRVDGANPDVFGDASGDIAGLHIRYDDGDRYVVSTSDADATIGGSGESQTYERGELVELDLTMPGAPATEPQLCDDAAPCEGVPPAIYTPVSATRTLDAVHVIESGYFGHFSIASSGGDTCSATTITIRKHAGLTHTTETHYTGSIIISNSLNDGTWAKDVTANGALTPLGMDTGRAIYTFTADDDGEVILYITGTTATTTFDVDVRSNGLTYETVTAENASEDPNIVINDLVTAITYGDDFGSVSYSNNDGIAGFAGAWAEAGDDGSAASGKIRISGGELQLNNQGGGATAITRQIDFSGYGVDAPPVLSFNFNKSGTPSHSLLVRARGNSGDAWTTLATYTSATSSGLKSFSFTEAPWNIVTSATTEIRFEMSGSSPNGTEHYKVDGVQVSTETNDCGVGGAVDHYAVSHDGAMVSCLVELITITPHSAADLTIEPGAGVVLTLQTSTNKGFWGPPLSGGGTFQTAATNNGFATYTYLLGEGQLTFPFYYTELAADSEVVDIAVSDDEVPSNTDLENSSLVVAKTGFVFYDEVSGNPVIPTQVAAMPSSSRGHVLNVQAVRSSDENPTVCEAVFPDGGDVNVEIGVECIDPSGCTAGTEMTIASAPNTGNVPAVNSDLAPGLAAGFTSTTLHFDNDNAARIVLTYPDAGSVQLHARYPLIVDDEDGNPMPSGDYIEGSSNAFVVRPFGYRIDFNQDRENSYDPMAGDPWMGALSYAADASDPDAFISAGTPFNATVAAVAWQPADDADNDGVPDDGAVLADNAVTPNYGQEGTGTSLEDDVEISFEHVLPDPLSDGVVGDFTVGAPYADFTLGSAVQTLSYSEVGIIDIIATLDDGDYLDGGESITGTAYNVGRFRPADFVISAPMLTARPLFPPNTGGGFTYMGEEFTASFMLTARNTNGQTTENYFGDFAKLTTPAQLSFYAIDDIAMADDVTYTSRLSKVVGGTNPFPADFESAWTAGAALLDGNLVFARLGDHTPDGPFGGVQVAVTVLDSDNVIDVNRNVDDDDGVTEPGTALYRLLGEHEFRYGRLRLTNGYGSEIADYWDHDNDDDGINPTPTPEVPLGHDVSVRVVAEYWDGSNFVTNEDDIATPFDSDSLSFIAGTFTDNLSDSTAPYDGDNEAVITDTSGTVYRGATLETAGQNDLPLYLRAPLLPNNEGSALVELDLDALGLSFLKFDWRDGSGGGVDAEADVKADPDDYSMPDNPRALIEFGTFRGNDRIINWQEIFE